MEIKTFNYIEFLKQKFGDEWDNYEKIVDYELLKNTKNIKSIDFTELLKKMYGIFPVNLLKTIYKNNNKIKLLDIKKSIQEIPNGRNYLAEKFNMPSPHMVNYEWRYTESSAKKIVDVIKNKKDIKMCCLGTPTIAIELIIQGYSKNTTFLDINTPMVHFIKSIDSDIVCYEYDVQDIIPSYLINNYDVILMNPPWYLDYYKTFLSRAKQLMKKKGGTIICPLFSPLCNKTALSNLFELKNFIDSLSYTEIKSLDTVEFETPNFEKEIFIKNEIQVPGSNWREAELIEIFFESNEKVCLLSKVKLEKNKWIRFYNFNTKEYWALNINFVKNNKKAYKFDFKYVNNISRKELCNLYIDLWDNKNNIIIFRK